MKIIARMECVQLHRVAQLARDLPELSLSPDVSRDNEMEGLHILGTFNGFILGLVSFKGKTRWERHPGGEELLQIMEGATELRQYGLEGETSLVAQAGDVVQIPANVWHSQRTLTPVKLMFVTPAEGTEHCLDPSR
jgi:quercetin dioxygenase-like cupin family protein